MKPNQFAILVGTNTLAQLALGGYRYLVKDFIIHEDYDERVYGNDIGLIRVKGPIRFNDRVQPIPVSREVVPENVELLVTGSGRLDVNATTVD